MDKTIYYKTRPLFFITSMTLLGYLFFGFLFLLTFSGANGNYNIVVISILTIFGSGSLLSLFYFLTTKTIRLKNQSLEISYFFLPITKTIMFKDIRSIEQKNKAVKALYGTAFKTRYIFTEYETIIKLTDHKTIKINSIGQGDFEMLYKMFSKLKRGEGKIKEQKNIFSLYVIDNLDGIFWVLLMLILTVGLGYTMLTR